jgi:hypothetical protein
MPGSPQKRAIQEREAIRRVELTAQAQAKNTALRLPRSRVKFTQALADEIIGLISNGIAIEDSVLNGAVIAQGIASRMGIHPSTFYEWQQRHGEFADGIARAREESAHRIADRMLSLADVALSEPALANAVRVAGDILKWQAMVRNRRAYGDKSEGTGQVQAGITVILQHYSDQSASPAVIEHECETKALD